MDSALQLRAAARAYRTSLASLGVVVVFSIALLPFGIRAGVAAVIGGLVAWLPHVYMIGKVFGLSLRGVRAVSVAGLLTAEAIKLILTAGLFVIAYALVRADDAVHLLLGFIVALAANVAATAALSRRLDNQYATSERE